MKLSSDKIISNLVAVPLFLVPLVFSLGSTRYYVPKAAFLQLSSFIILTVWLIRLIGREHRAASAGPPFDLPVFLFFAWTGLSLIWATNRHLVLEELVFFGSLTALYYVVSRTELSLPAVSSAVSGAGALVALYGMLQFYGIDIIVPPPSQVISTMGNVNFGGEFTAAAAFITFALFLNSSARGRVFWGAAGLMQVAYLLATGARGAWVGFLAGVIVFSILGSPVSGRGRRFFVYILSGLAASFLMVYLIAGREAMSAIAGRFSSIIDLEHPTVRVRLCLWRSVLDMIRENPISGAGAGNLRVVYPLFRSLEELRISGVATEAARAHNDYLEIFADLGIIGFGLFAWVVALAVKTVKSRWRRMSWLEVGFVSGMACILVSAMFGFPLKTHSTALLFWVGLGLMARSAAGGKYMLPGRPGALTAVSIFVLIFVLNHTVAWFVSDAHVRKAQIFARRHEIEKAADELETALMYYPSSARGRIMLAEIYVVREDFESAAPELKSLLGLYPNHAWARRLLGQAYLRFGEYDKAAAELEEAARLNPGYASYLGYAYIITADLEKAESVLLRQINSGFGDGDAYRLLGDTYERKKQNEKAVEFYRKALEINPGFKNLHERIERLSE